MRATTSKKLVVILCLCALAALVCVQTLHTHVGASGADQTHCSICAVMHGAVMAICLILLMVAVLADLRRLQCDLFDFPALSQFAGFALFSRPPPLR